MLSVDTLVSLAVVDSDVESMVSSYIISQLIWSVLYHVA